MYIAYLALDSWYFTLLVFVHIYAVFISTKYSTRSDLCNILGCVLRDFSHKSPAMNFNFNFDASWSDQRQCLLLVLYKLYTWYLCSACSKRFTPYFFFTWYLCSTNSEFSPVLTQNCQNSHLCWLKNAKILTCAESKLSEFSPVLTQNWLSPLHPLPMHWLIAWVVNVIQSNHDSRRCHNHNNIIIILKVTVATIIIVTFLIFITCSIFLSLIPVWAQTCWRPAAKFIIANT